MNSLHSISDLLLDADNFLILTHERPDGDAFGCVVALLLLLNKMGKKAEAYFPEKVPERYQYLIPTDNVFIQAEPSLLTAAKLEPPTTCVCLDCGNTDRLAVGRYKEIILSLPIINIDHHHDNELYGKYNYIDSKACSTAEIIFDLFKSSDEWQVTPDTATAIIMGMLMDTGGFRFDNTNSRVLQKAAELMDLGANYIEGVDER